MTQLPFIYVHDFSQLTMAQLSIDLPNIQNNRYFLDVHLQKSSWGIVKVQNNKIICNGLRYNAPGTRKDFAGSK